MQTVHKTVSSSPWWSASDVFELLIMVGGTSGDISQTRLLQLP